MTFEVFKYKVTNLPKVIFRKLGKEQSHGLYHSDGTIEIDSRLRGKKLCEILYHEFLHFQYPEMTEEDVIKKARELTEFMWKLGYRRIDEEEQSK